MCNYLCSVIVLCGMMMMDGSRWNPVLSHSLLFSKNTKGPPGLTSPSDGLIAINSTICVLNIHTAKGFVIQSRLVMYNVAIRKCTYPPVLAPTLKIFKWKFTTPPGIEPRTCRTRGRHATFWASAANFSPLMCLISLVIASRSSAIVRGLYSCIFCP